MPTQSFICTFSRSTLFALCLSCSPVPGQSQESALAADGASDAVQRAGAWARELSNSHPGGWREAQIRLARLCPESLPLLEAELDRAGGAPRPRVRDALSLALLMTSGHAALPGHPVLTSAFQPELDAARSAVTVFRQATVVDLGETPPGAAAPPTAARAAFLELEALGGFAIPVALELCADARAAQRAYGVLVLRRAGAVGAKAALERLIGDAASIQERGADWVGSATVGELARQTLEKAPAFRLLAKNEVFFEVEAYVLALQRLEGQEDLRLALINGLRKTPARGARSWEEWWDLGRPAWREWWRLAQTAEDCAARDAAFAAWLEARGDG